MATLKEDIKKQDALWREVLYSADKKSIKEALNVLRDNGNVRILSDILKIYKAYKGTELGSIIYNFLVDLKSSDAVPVIIDAIDDVELKSIRIDLLNLCWQSSLDFYPYFEKFVDIFINAELLEAFEAFTIIEYLEFFDANDLIYANIEKLEQNIDKISADKKELLVDLVNILRNKLS